mgnify:FL=1|tara:strand:- start:671 stop:952 length:282 start_codon:yes stop_codon:yes gene_type:complete
MASENLKKNFKNILIKIEKKIDPKVSEEISDQKISNIELNKIRDNSIKNKFNKICVNKLQERLRKKQTKEKFENRILFSLFFSIVAVLFFITT